MNDALLENCKSDNVSLAKQACGAGADVTHCDPRKKSALHIASARGNAELVQYLLEEGANIDAKDGLTQTSLLLACDGKKESHALVAQLLLERGGRNLLEAVDREGRTALMRAVLRRNEAVVRVLIAEGSLSALTVRDKCGLNAIEMAQGGLGAMLRGEQSDTTL